MVVDQKYRRKGVGTFLLNKMIDTFKDVGVDFVLLNCPSTAENAFKMYEKEGFQIRAYHMSKRLK